MYQFEFTRMVNLARERLKANNNKDFPRITREVVRGTGITNPADQKRILDRLRAELTKRSAEKRKADAIAKREAKELHKKIAP